METLDDFLETIPVTEHRTTLQTVLQRVRRDHPDLELQIKWKQPMLVREGTFIIGFSASKPHFSVAPEKVILDEFLERIVEAGYEHTKMQFKIRWDQAVNWGLLEAIVERSIEYKQGCETFWA